MPEPEVRTAVPEDADKMVKNLRAVDRIEIKKHSGRGALQMLQGAFAISGPNKIYSIDRDGQILAMFGVRLIKFTHYERVGAPWMVCSDELLQKYRRRYLQEYPIWVNEISTGYTLLENYVYAKNKLHIKWLKWAGFELVEYIEQFGVGKAPFWRFQMRIKKKMIQKSILKQN